MCEGLSKREYRDERILVELTKKPILKIKNKPNEKKAIQPLNSLSFNISL